MDFKEQINSDLDIFFNINEFSESHTINGKIVNLIIDNETLKQRNRKEYDGILQADLLYYVKATDILKRPISGQVQNIDGLMYTVFDVKYDFGVYEVILQAGRS